MTVQLAEYQADLLSRDVEVFEDLIYLRSSISASVPPWWMLFVTTFRCVQTVSVLHIAAGYFLNQGT